MIWLSWRQHRIELLVIGIGLALLAALLIQNGLVINAAFHRVEHGVSVATCIAQQNSGSLCQSLISNFHSAYNDPNDLLIVSLVPILVGMFLGAPLVARELERGTFRLIWTQSMTQLRWLLVKVGMQLAITLIAFAIINQLVTWYIAQNGSFGGSGWDHFDMVGIAPLAYIAFALALGVAAGAITRHTIPAMVATLIGYIGVRDVIANLVRPYYLPPSSSGTFDPYVTTPKTLPGNQDWITAVTWTDHVGHVISNTQIGQACSSPVPMFGIPLPLRIPLPLNFPRSFNCTHAHGWLQTITWQPVDRAWLFQGIESAVFFCMAVGLLVLTYWWIRERIR
jgi:ABC-type transport system involved in multi-copper enzyme maturation permease subunit